MAENQDAGLNIEVNAVANKKSAEQAVNELASGVQQASKKGRIEVPVDITVPIDDTKKKLTEAQKDITSELSKMMTKGFSASGKDIDTLTSKFDKFTKALDAAGKGRQNKIFREIRKQVEEIQKSYRALKAETKSTKPYTAKATSTKKPRRTRNHYISDEEVENDLKRNARETQNKQLKGGPNRLGSTPPTNYKTRSNVDAGKTNEHLMRLSEYSAHGSNWANALAKTLKEEMAKSAKTLVTYIDPSYTKKTKNGRSTTEQEFLSDTIKNVRTQLKNNIAQLEAGSEEITLDALKEQAAVIKVLTKALGKTTEDAEKAISSAIQSRYTQSEKKRLGGTGLEAGEEKGVGPGHENTQSLIKQLYKAMKQWDSEVFADKIAKEMVLGVDKVSKTSTKKSTQISPSDKFVGTVKTSETYKADLNKLNNATEEIFDSVRGAINETSKVNRSVKIGNTKEAVEFDQSEKINKENKDINRDTAKAVKADANTGFNTDNKADELIQLVTSILSILQELRPKTPSRLALPEPKGGMKSLGEMRQIFKDSGLNNEQIHQKLADISNVRKGKTGKPERPVTNGPTPPKGLTGETEPYKNRVEKSKIYASPFNQSIWKSIEDAFESLTGTTRRYNKILKANADDQDMMAAERIKTYGLNNGRNPNDTGDIAGMRRILQLYRTNKTSIEQNPELAQKIQLTGGREVDTTEITKALNKALSGKNMRNAQMGGSIPRQILGAMTGFIGMPSLEKSRAQADGLNQILGNVNKALQSVLINIQMKETELAGMEKTGQAKFDKNGYLTSDSSSAAFKTLADLEEEKLVLDSIKADLLANDEIIKKTGGRFDKLAKQMSFTSPVLRENNGILRNITSGLDKNGKALKFQTRMAEILNYTFQLMSRSIGQMIKNWLSMLNPINLIKRAFTDFGSYNVKWQRTMNVIKNNFREIILPFMDKIAQTLVNIIGFLDIISMKIQEAFGFTPISLFDQKNANDFKKTYEEIQSVTASFDELHDIGSNSENDANNLLGDIYKPQLSQDWIDLANKIGDLFAHVIKGDMGFGEVCLEILKLLGELLAKIGKAIWDWFKETAIGKWITEHWKGLLATLLALFLGWQLLKIFGPTLLSTIGSAFKNLGSLIWSGLKGVGNKFLDVLCGTQFGSDMVRGFKAMFNSGGMIGTFKAGGASLGAIFTQALVAVAGCSYRHRKHYERL